MSNAPLQQDVPFGQDDLFAAAPGPAPARPRRRRRHLDRGNLLLAGLFAAGIACVYLLSLSGGPEKASAETQRAEKEVQVAIAMMNDPKSLAMGKAQGIVDSFYYEARQRQVPLKDLAGNPSIYREPEATEPKVIETPGGVTVPDPAVEAANRNAAEMMEIGRKLRLQSVLKGPGGTAAMIDNNVLTAGQTISGWTVESIQAHRVVLRWKDRTLELEMEH